MVGRNYTFATFLFLSRPPPTLSCHSVPLSASRRAQTPTPPKPLPDGLRPPAVLPRIRSFTDDPAHRIQSFADAGRPLLFVAAPSANQPRPPCRRRRRDGFVGGVPGRGREPGGHHHPHRAEVPKDRDPPQTVEAGGSPEDGARGFAAQDPRRAMQVGELDRGAPRDDGDQGRRWHVQLPGSRVLRHPDEVPLQRFIYRG